MTTERTATQRALRDVAERLADAARVETLRYFRGAALNTKTKLSDGFDPVTEADTAAEAVMRDLLAQDRPEDSILGEEFGQTVGQSGWTWVLDPIDGTRAYVAGAPTWGTLIAVGQGGRPAFGIIDQPYIGERFIGGFGEARLMGPHGDRALRTSDCDHLRDAILMTTFPEVGTQAEGAAFSAVSAEVKLTRYGLDCYAYGLLALGQVDLVIEAGLKPYDIQAPIAVIEAAGGVVTDWRGGSAHQGGRVIAAANPTLHALALEHLAETR